MADKPFRDMTADELRAEWQKWDDEITSATCWGAAIGVADSFRKQCAREMERREVAIGTKE